MAKTSLPNSFSIDNLPVAAKPTGSRFRDLEGQRFGVFTAVAYCGQEKRRTYWWCRCSLCGAVVRVGQSHLVRALYQSCGCRRYDIIRSKVTTHGARRTQEYAIYCAAKARCQNPNNPRFSSYGGRGIEFRFNSFEEFFEAVGRRPSRKYSLDRINNNGHYESGNVRWATNSQQVRNSSAARLLTFNKQTRPVAEWAEITGLRSHTIRQRLDRQRWCTECALTIPSDRELVTKKTCKHGKGTSDAQVGMDGDSPPRSRTERAVLVQGF